MAIPDYQSCMLARFMIDYGVGVAPAASYVVKRIDLDFFEDA